MTERSLVLRSLQEQWRRNIERARQAERARQWRECADAVREAERMARLLDGAWAWECEAGRDGPPCGHCGSPVDVLDHHAVRRAPGRWVYLHQGCAEQPGWPCIGCGARLPFPCEAVEGPCCVDGVLGGVAR